MALLFPSLEGLFPLDPPLCLSPEVPLLLSQEASLLLLSALLCGSLEAGLVTGAGAVHKEAK